MAFIYDQMVLSGIVSCPGSTPGDFPSTAVAHNCRHSKMNVSLAYTSRYSPVRKMIHSSCKMHACVLVYRHVNKDRLLPTCAAGWLHLSGSRVLIVTSFVKTKGLGMHIDDRIMLNGNALFIIINLNYTGCF